MKGLISTFVILAVIVNLAQGKPFSLNCNGNVLEYGENISSISGGQGGAIPQKNQVKGPADIGIYYINSPGVSCGGMKTAQCSTSCGALGYPVYWCYPKVCYCHYGNSAEEANAIPDDVPTQD